MTTLKHLVYCATCVLFITIIGAAVYEHSCVWPFAWQAPPASLSMFQGEYGMNNQGFWTRIHPATLLFFVATTILFWKSERRPYLLIALACYGVVIVWTFIYFVPELMALTAVEFTPTIDQSLVDRAGRWETLSFVRLAIIVVAAFVLLTGLSKPAKRAS